MKNIFKVLSVIILPIGALCTLSAFQSTLSSKTVMTHSYEVNQLAQDGFIPPIVQIENETNKNANRAPASYGGLNFGPFQCVKRSMGNHADDRYLAMHATMVRDSYVGRDMTQKNVNGMKRDMIRRLRDMGYCKPGYVGNRRMSPNVQGWIDGSKPLSTKRGFWFLKTHRANPQYEAEFEATFGLSYNKARHIDNIFRNTTHPNRHWRAVKGTPLLGGRCVRFRSLQACRNLAASCGIKHNFCDEKNHRRGGGDGPSGTNGGGDNGGGDNGGGDNGGGDNGGGDDGGGDDGGGNNGNNGTGTNGPGGEVGGGSNDGAGHGADGGGGQGAGPGGVGQ